MDIETDDEDDAIIKSTLVSLRKSQGGTTEFNKYLKLKGLDEDFVKDVLLSACSDWEDADKVRILQNVKNQGKETKTQIILFTNEMSR